MKKVLINFAHPNKLRSIINTSLKSAISDLENVTVNDLYANYPDFLIDVKREQELCENHDIIIFQHPLYWYSTPAIIKEWMDLVLEHGWAYGFKGNFLKDKFFMQAISTGGGESAFAKGGANGFTIKEITSPFQAMTNLCKAIWLPPFTVFGTHKVLPKEMLNFYAESYRRTIIALRDETINLKKARKLTNINKNLDSIIKGF